MANSNLEVSLALNSSGFRAEVNKVKKDNQLLRAEFEKLASATDDFEDSLEGKQARLKLVRGEYENAQKMVQIYKKQVEESRKAVEEANKKLKDQETVLNSARAYVERYKDATGETAKVVAETEAKIAELEKEFQKQAKAVVSANNQYQQMQINLANAETSLNNLGNELQNSSKDAYKFSDSIEDVERQLEETKKEMEALEKKGQDFAKSMSEIGQGIIVVGDKLGELGQKGLSAIGSLVSKGAEWSASVSGQEFVYNTLDEAIQKVIDTSAKQSTAIGLTEQQYKSAATNMASYYKNMGLTTEETENLIGETMNLVADLGAVNDIPFDEAMSRFKSGLMGNYEALDQFNINLSAGMLENSEFVKSLGKSWNQLSDNEKMMAAYNEISRQGSFATGLASQEAESFSMKMNLVKQQVSEAAGTIGETLLPTLEPVIGMISQVVSNIVAWVQENPQLTTTILGVVGVVSGLFAILGPLITAIGMGVIAFGAIHGAVISAGGAMALFTTTILPIIAVVAGVIAIVVALAIAIKENWSAIQEATNNLIETCRPYFEQLKESFSNLWEVCQDIYNTVIQPLFMMIGQVIETCINFASPFLQLLMGVFSRMINSFVEMWNTFGKPLFSLIMSVIQGLFNFVKPIFDQLAGIFSSMVSVMFGIYDNTLKPMFDGFRDAVKILGDKVKPTFDNIKNAISNAMDTISNAISGALSFIKNLIDTIGGALSKVGEFVSSLNPFKGKSIDMDMNMNVNRASMPFVDLPMLTQDVALSGSYYDARTPLSNGLARLGSVASGLAETGVNLNQVVVDNSNIENILQSKLDSLISAIQSITIQPNLEFAVDGYNMTGRVNQINNVNAILNERR